MTDLEISKALALAIGWKEECLRATDKGNLYAYRAWWREFSYLDWNVIGPIAERYDAFPIKLLDCKTPDKWEAYAYAIFGEWERADTPQKAIALAVIECERAKAEGAKK